MFLLPIQTLFGLAFLSYIFQTNNNNNNNNAQILANNNKEISKSLSLQSTPSICPSLENINAYCPQANDVITAIESANQLSDIQIPVINAMGGYIPNSYWIISFTSSNIQSGYDYSGSFISLHVGATSNSIPNSPTPVTCEYSISSGSSTIYVFLGAVFDPECIGQPYVADATYTYCYSIMPMQTGSTFDDRACQNPNPTQCLLILDWVPSDASWCWCNVTEFNQNPPCSLEWYNS